MRCWRGRTPAPAGTGLPPPHWEGPPIPIWNETHDALIDVWKAEREAREAEEERLMLCAVGVICPPKPVKKV